MSTVRLAKSYSRRFVRTFLGARGTLDEHTNGNTRWRSWRVRGGDATAQSQLAGLESSDAYFAIPSYILVNQA
jgi:hypothetical protein